MARPTNRPGLTQLDNRLADRRTFLASMLDRLSSTDFPALTELTTRDPSDPAIALLDAWATVADVISFYQERIANEGYLRTAVERRSIIELARLVGWQPRPGVAASVWLAFNLEQDHDVTIPAGTKTQSVPGPGELPQVFETSEPLDARAAWNTLAPRLGVPHDFGTDGFEVPDAVWLKGTNTGLNVDDPVLLRRRGPAGSDAPEEFQPRRVAALEIDAEHDRTKVVFAFVARRPPVPVHDIAELVTELAPPTRTLPSLTPGAPSTPQFIASARSELATPLWQAIANTTPMDVPIVDVFAFRIRARLFGHAAPPRMGFIRNPDDDSEEGNGEGPSVTAAPFPEFVAVTDDWPLHEDQPNKSIDLNGDFPQLRPHTEPDSASAPELASYLLIDPGLGSGAVGPIRVEAVTSEARTDYGMAGPVTRVKFPDDPDEEDDGITWWIGGVVTHIPDLTMTVLRSTVVYAGTEPLALADQPLEACVGPDGGGDEGGDTTPVVQLDSIYNDLQPGRPVIVAGSRDDLPGVESTDHAVIAEVEHTADAGDTWHTSVTLSGLTNCYERATVRIYGNVVHATHGETRFEVLGSGDASLARQKFVLKQRPLTYVSAPDEDGMASTLRVEIDEVAWSEAPSVVALASDDDRYTTSRDDDQVTEVIFGDGHHGRRLPTGRENVRVIYRSGIGSVGNVGSGKITQVLGRPLGVKDVVNPLPATGGVDADRRDQARELAPRSVRALGRAVSLTDYEDFAALFGGVGKARATRLTSNVRSVVHLTVAGVDDAPLEGSDTVDNLRAALVGLGEPSVPVVVQVRARNLLVIRAGVAVEADRRWSLVRPSIVASLEERFGFDRMSLGAGIASSEVIAAIQSVPGVNFVDLDVLGAISDTDIAPNFEAPGEARGIAAAASGAAFSPAGLLLLDTNVPGTLTLEAIG